MQFKFALCVLLTLTFEIVIATDYCDKSLCYTGKHIGCDNDRKFASICINPAMVKLSQEYKDLILDLHNTKRNLVAGGETKLESACRMATMQWDDELAYLASLNVKQCEMEHDSCHNTKTFHYSGQNLAMDYFSDPLDMPKSIERMINMWYGEIENTKMEYINTYPYPYTGPAIGHFIGMVADRNIRVGCAASRYETNGDSWITLLFACNYAKTVGNVMYASCPNAASKCETGVNPRFKNLCSVSEEYDVNEYLYPLSR